MPDIHHHGTLGNMVSQKRTTGFACLVFNSAARRCRLWTWLIDGMWKQHAPQNHCYNLQISPEHKGSHLQQAGKDVGWPSPKGLNCWVWNKGNRGEGVENTHNQKWLLIRDNDNCFSLEKQTWNLCFRGTFLASTADVRFIWDRSTVWEGPGSGELCEEQPVVAEADQSLNNFRVIWRAKAPMWR